MTMLPRLRLATMATTILLAVPGTALAQNAGEDQYSDPFGRGGDAPSRTKKKSSGSSGGQNQGAPAQAQVPAAGSGQAGAGADAQAAAEAAAGQAAAGSGSSASGRDELPLTGTDTLWVALSGAGLLGAGFALRRRSAG